MRRRRRRRRPGETTERSGDPPLQEVGERARERWTTGAMTVSSLEHYVERETLNLQEEEERNVTRSHLVFVLAVFLIPFLFFFTLKSQNPFK